MFTYTRLFFLSRAVSSCVSPASYETRWGLSYKRVMSSLFKSCVSSCCFNFTNFSSDQVTHLHGGWAIVMFAKLQPDLIMRNKIRANYIFTRMPLKTHKSFVKWNTVHQGPASLKTIHVNPWWLTRTSNMASDHVASPSEARFGKPCWCRF